MKNGTIKQDDFPILINSKSANGIHFTSPLVFHPFTTNAWICFMFQLFLLHNLLLLLGQNLSSWYVSHSAIAIRHSLTFRLWLHNAIIESQVELSFTRTNELRCTLLVLLILHSRFVLLLVVPENPSGSVGTYSIFQFYVRWVDFLHYII